MVEAGMGTATSMTTSAHSAHGAFSVRLPAVLGSARVARQLLGELLAQVRTPDRLVREAQLVLHELVMNGVTHGESDEHGDIGVCCALSENDVRLCVQDEGTTGRVAAKPPTKDQDSGRGLAIVAALSESWRVDRSHGTAVSARLLLDSAAGPGDQATS
jgi:anti-sigma regulatory factor (Ser/Thr protein kinase)